MIVRRPARISVIDDEPQLVRTFARFLEREGYRVRTATSFAEMEARLHPGDFDLLIVDAAMPGRTGLEVLREVRRRGCTAPVILITGEVEVADEHNAGGDGHFAVIHKPLTKDRLLDAVDRALSAAAEPRR